MGKMMIKMVEIILTCGIIINVYNLKEMIAWTAAKGEVMTGYS
jgi:hypothetical protein